MSLVVLVWGCTPTSSIEAQPPRDTSRPFDSGSWIVDSGTSSETGSGLDTAATDTSSDTGSAPGVDPCGERTVCPATFYYNQNDPKDVPDLSRHHLVVLNHQDQFEGASEIASAIDPDVIVLYYHLLDYAIEDSELYDWETVDANEDWFVHDASGARIEYPSSGGYHYWFMNLENEAYMAFKIAQFQALLERWPAVDGFYLDFPGFYEGFEVYTLPKLPCGADPETCPAFMRSEAQWDAFYVPGLAALEVGLGDAPVLNNNFLYAPFGAVVDGSLGEDVFHPDYWNDDQVYAESAWLSQVEDLGAPEQAGKMPFASSGASSTADKARWVSFTLASYLLGRRADGTPLFCYQNTAWLDEYDIDLGLPSGALEKGFDGAAGLYARPYDKGLVIANPSAQSWNATLSQSYVDLEGAVVSGEVTLEPATALVLRAL